MQRSGGWRHSSDEKFYIEPRLVDGGAVGSECLCIDRHSAELSLQNSSTIPVAALSQPVPIYGIVGIVRLIAGPYLVVVSGRRAAGNVAGQQLWQVLNTDIVPYARTTLHLDEKQQLLNRHYLQLLQHVLLVNTFYFSTTYDLTHSLQRLSHTSPDFRRLPLLQRADVRFTWNGFAMRELRREQLHQYCLPLMAGFVHSCQLQHGQRAFSLTVISRRACARAGVRFYSRGVDQEGNASNFVETEQILQFGSTLCAFVQTRGSIPLFWSQRPNLRWQPWIKLRVDSHLTAFEAHMKTQLYIYGKQVIVNLVNRHGREKEVGEALEHAANSTQLQDIRCVSFDFHRQCRPSWLGLALLLEQLDPALTEFGYLRLEGEQVRRVQSGVFRSNCIDCLDRTNVVQSLLARKQLLRQLKDLRVYEQHDSELFLGELEDAFKNIWADNGDSCSLQYAGTHALKTDFTRLGRRTLLGRLRDLSNAVVRYYRNNFADGYRQDAIDLFLGNFAVDAELQPDLAVLRRDWQAVVPFVFLVAFAMFVLSLIFSAERFFVAFWLLVALLLLAAIIYYGEEFVNRPRLKLD